MENKMELSDYVGKGIIIVLNGKNKTVSGRLFNPNCDLGKGKFMVLGYSPNRHKLFSMRIWYTEIKEVYLMLNGEKLLLYS